MKNLFVRFVREEAGQDLIEYGLLIGIVTVALIAAVRALTPTIITILHHSDYRPPVVVSRRAG